MSTHPTKITFFEFLIPLILAGKKTITIRDETESHYQANTLVEVFTLETDQKMCDIRILSVERLQFNDINQFHAEQEAMELGELQTLIRQIYPDTDNLYMITYELI